MQDMLGSFVLLVALLQTCKSAVIEDIQTFNGEGNNIQHPQWGAVGDVYLRMATPAYGPNQAPAGSSRPNARLVSSMLFGQKPFNQNNGRISDFLAAWGLNTHLDITFAAKNTSDPFPIQVPSGDPDFDPMGTNKSVIPMYRAAYAGVDVTNNARISKNSFTSFIDGSGLYGNSDSEAASMRAFTGGLLKTAYTSTGEYPPRTVGGPMDGYFEFTIGNVNIAPQVLVLHLLFHREHNRRARELAVQSPNWTDEQLYQRARRWVIAILQKITISFYVPALTGTPLEAYKGYNLDTNPQVDLFFSQVAFIYGHSALNPEILRINQNGEPIHEGHLELKSASFKFLCDEVIKVGIDPIIRGFIVQRDQIIDTHIIDDVRNNLPLNPGFLFDLAAIGIQRGRDMGIPDWNTCRTMFNLTPITSWADLNNLTDDPESLEILQTLYPNLNDVDAAVGTLAEKISLSNSVVGPLVAVSIRDQFRRLRDGDRFWYENPGVLTASELVELESMSLGRVVTLNTNVSYFPDDPFVILNDSTTYFLEGPLSQITQVLSQPIVNVLDNLRLSWNVSLTDATITFLFETNATGWFAFGFGTSMVQADIYFCNDDGTGAFGVQDSFSNTTQPPKSDVIYGGKSNVYNVKDLTSILNYSVRVVQFSRSLDTGDTFDTVINSGDMDVIFAFSSTTDSVWHGPANRVHTRINFFSFGVTGLPVPPSPSSLLILHSVSMFIAFAILYPLGIYVARYYRNLGRWLAIHQNLLSSVTSNVAVAALTAIIGTFGNVNSAHYKVGMAVIGLIALNFMCGSTAMKLYNMHHKWSSLASVLKTIHKYSGIVAYLVGIAACYLGVAELSTQESGTYLELSFLIIVLIVPVTLFVYGEREKHFATASKDDMGLNNLPFFRWEDVNQRVSLGAKWIVIDNIIYDVHKYLNFHPGGPHALYQMIGIDAKFAFDPKKAQSKDKDGQKMKKAIEFHKYDPELEKLMHCHSRFAKNLLSGFAMGQLRGEESLEASNSSSSTNLLASSDSDSLLESGRIRRPRTIPVHVEIYKHYIIEKKIQLTSPNAPNAVYLIRLMFEDEHAEISNKPGDSYLFQFVDATGKLVTRSYTPISCVSNGGIDFMIKMYNGEMTHYLMNAQSVRMRGPVPRAHLLNPFSDTGTWKVLGLIAGGTGITAMLLVIDYHMRNCKRDPITNKPDFQIHVLFSNTQEDSIFAQKELTMMEAHSNGALTVTYIVSNASDSFEGLVGSISSEVISATMPKVPAVFELKKSQWNENKQYGLQSQSGLVGLKTKTTSNTEGKEDLLGLRSKSPLMPQGNTLRSISPKENQPDNFTEYGNQGLMEEANNMALIVCGPTLMNVQIGDMLRGMGYKNVLTL